MNIVVRPVIVLAVLIVSSANDAKPSALLELKASFDNLIKQAIESLPANVREPLKASSLEFMGHLRLWQVAKSVK